MFIHTIIMDREQSQKSDANPEGGHLERTVKKPTTCILSEVIYQLHILTKRQSRNAKLISKSGYNKTTINITKIHLQIQSCQEQSSNGIYCEITM